MGGEERRPGERGRSPTGRQIFKDGQEPLLVVGAGKKLHRISDSSRINHPRGFFSEGGGDSQLARLAIGSFLKPLWFLVGSLHRRGTPELELLLQKRMFTLLFLQDLRRP